MIVPVWIVTWILHLAIKSPVPWMSNDCSRFPAFVSLSSPSGFSAHRSLNLGLSDDDQSGGHDATGWRILCQFLYRKNKQQKTKKMVSFSYLFSVSIGLCNLSVASGKCVLQESVFARGWYLWNYKFTTLISNICTSCDDLPHCECMTKNILQILSTLCYCCS